MDPRERFDDLEEIIHTAIDRKLTRVWTALPVKVLADSDGFVVQPQPTIKGKQIDPQSGKLNDIAMPSLGASVPVHFASGGGFTITHPVKSGDEGIAIFSSRCIDGWWDKGDLQPQLETRRHNLSDAMYVPGIRSKPRKLNPPASTTSIQIRTDKGDVYVEVTADSVNIVTTQKVTVKCVEMDVTASSRVAITSPLVTINASDKISIDSPLIETTGKITAQGDVTAGSVSLQNHTHGNVQGGLSHTGPPDQ
jgi:phage baseplate assembly protein gpV